MSWQVIKTFKQELFNGSYLKEEFDFYLCMFIIQTNVLFDSTHLYGLE